MVSLVVKEIKHHVSAHLLGLRIFGELHLLIKFIVYFYSLFNSIFCKIFTLVRLDVAKTYVFEGLIRVKIIDDNLCENLIGLGLFKNLRVVLTYIRTLGFLLILELN